MELLRFWHNRRWGWSRRVIKLYEDGDGYRVEAIDGSGDRAMTRAWRPPTEEDALQLADELMDNPDQDWHEISRTGDE